MACTTKQACINLQTIQKLVSRHNDGISSKPAPFAMIKNILVSKRINIVKANGKLFRYSKTSTI